MENTLLATSGVNMIVPTSFLHAAVSRLPYLVQRPQQSAFATLF